MKSWVTPLELVPINYLLLLTLNWKYFCLWNNECMNKILLWMFKQCFPSHWSPHHTWVCSQHCSSKPKPRLQTIQQTHWLSWLTLILSWISQSEVSIIVSTNQKWVFTSIGILIQPVKIGIFLVFWLLICKHSIIRC